MTTSNDQLCAWTKKLQSTSQSQTCIKQRHGHCLVVWCPSDPLEVSKFKKNLYIWGICSANQWDILKIATPAADTGQQKGLNSFAQLLLMACYITKASKVGWIGLWSFASSIIFAWFQANWLPLLQVSWQLFFAGKTLPQPAGGRKCFSRVGWIPKHGFLCYRNK